MGVLLDRQEQASGGVDEVEMIETDARELGERDGEDGEINTGNAEAKRQKAEFGAVNIVG